MVECWPTKFDSLKSWMLTKVFFCFSTYRNLRGESWEMFMNMREFVAWTELFFGTKKITDIKRHESRQEGQRLIWLWTTQLPPLSPSLFQLGSSKNPSTKPEMEKKEDSAGGLNQDPKFNEQTEFAPGALVAWKLVQMIRLTIGLKGHLLASTAALNFGGVTGPFFHQKTSTNDPRCFSRLRKVTL